MRTVVLALVLAAAGCDDSRQPTRVRIVAVYQEGPVAWGGGEASWNTTVEVISSGQRFTVLRKLGERGDEFTMKVGPSYLRGPEG